MIRHDLEQYGPEWRALRLGKPTASNAKKLVTSTDAVSKSINDYAIELANDLFAGKAVDAWDGNKHTERGTELEPEARASYEMTNQVAIEEIGMFTDDLLRWGASPDGIIGDDGLIEIKCLCAKNHTKALLYFNKNGKAPTDYIAQIQMQLMLSERKWCDLVLYHPELPGLTVRIEPDNKVITTLKTQLVACDIERNRVLDILKLI